MLMERESLPLEIAETARALRRAFDQRAATLGVTRAQWRVLATLSRAPGIKQVELADRLEIEPITLCRHIDRLEEAGFVERQRDPADRRAWRLQLTAKACPLVKKLRALATEFAGDAFDGIGPAETAALSHALARVRDNLGGSTGQAKKSA